MIPQARAGEPMVLAHYMPWYASKPVSGSWGWHWTMGHFDPDQGELATHDAPLIGPYDSGDPDALECHVLLMKLAGIDGVIVDWYGPDDFRDYAQLHRNTLKLIPFIRRAGLRFAICYEDQTVKHMVNEKFIPEAESLDRGKRVMAWMDEHWFRDDAHARIDDRPVLLVFGPQHFAADDWEAMLPPLSPRPIFFALPDRWASFGADGAFDWPLQKTEAPRDRPFIAAAWPGFHDIYAEAGVGHSYGFIDARGGKTFEETLARALASGSPLVQLVTWNDFGEGTVIEPTRALGYRHLETAQRRLNPSASPDDLRLPVELYALRKKNVPGLDGLAEALFAGDVERARKAMAGIRERATTPTR
jgi:hypothetical protein